MSDNGYIKIHRKIMKWEWGHDPLFFGAFIKLILLANWKDGRFEGHKISRGSFVSSYPNLSKYLGISVRSCRTLINKLKSTGEVTCSATRHFTIYVIVNYDKYQDNENESTGKTTCSSTGLRQGSDNNRRIEERKNKEYNTESSSIKTSSNFNKSDNIKKVSKPIDPSGSSLLIVKFKDTYYSQTQLPYFVTAKDKQAAKRVIELVGKDYALKLCEAFFTLPWWKEHKAWTITKLYENINQLTVKEKKQEVKIKEDGGFGEWLKKK